MLTLAEEANSASVVSKSPEEYINLAKEFGANYAAVRKTERAIAGRSKRQQAGAATGDVAIKNESYANPADVRQAKDFLASLPLACSGSSASASTDGTVIIRMSCEDASKSMSGSIKIKNGIVTEIQ